MRRFVLFFVLLLLLVLTSCHNDEEPEVKDINNVDMYINEEYANLDETDEKNLWWKKEAGVYAKDFFPKYEEIQYEYSNIDFFLHTYKHKTVFIDVALVLELEFESLEQYGKAKSDIMSTHSFLQAKVRDDDGIGYKMPSCDYKVGDFVVKIITDGEENDKFPNRIKAIAFSDKDYSVRYMYLYDYDSVELKIDTFTVTVGKLCNKEW